MMKKYLSIELLRFLSSISVLLYHYRHFFFPLNFLSTENYEVEKITLPLFNYFKFLYEYGFYGVPIFYTISGFVFAYIYLEVKKNTSLKEFSINRLARLYPLHFATLLFVAFFQIIFLNKHGNFQFDLLNDFYHFVLQLFFISSWGFQEGHSFNAPIWSVSIEIGVYIIFFNLIKYLKKFNIKFCLLICIILVLVDKLELFETLFLECARLFFSGVLIYFIASYKYKLKIFFFASIILLILSFIGNFKIFLFCPALVIFFISFENLISKLKYKSFFNLLGNLTYSLYLLHVPLQLMIIFLLKKYNFSLSIFNNYLFFLFYFFSLFLFSYLVFKFYEKPLNFKIRRYFLSN